MKRLCSFLVATTFLILITSNHLNALTTASPALGTVPKAITPVNSAVLSLSGVPSTAKFITFRWYKSQHATRLANVQATTFALVFAADTTFTKSVTRFNASSNQSYLIKGTPLSKIKTIQSASSVGSVFWQVEENNGGPVLKARLSSSRSTKILL